MHHPRVARFSLNASGRDFVIGDVHGAFDLVLAAMRRVKFDPTKDRLFSVGDLVDRGPQSRRALPFLSKSYAHAVPGNHEWNLLTLYAAGEPAPETLAYFSRTYKMQWWLELDEKTRAALLMAFSRLPVVIEVETARGTVGIVHGDIPQGMDWPTFCGRIEAGDEAVLAVALEGRDRLKNQREDGVPGVGRVYVGHTPQWGGARRFGNVYAVDTGAIFSQIFEDHEGHLTMAEMICRTEVFSTGRKVVDAVDVVLSGPEDGPTRPFGIYPSHRKTPAFRTEIKDGAAKWV